MPHMNMRRINAINGGKNATERDNQKEREEEYPRHKAHLI